MTSFVRYFQQMTKKQNNESDSESDSDDSSDDSMTESSEFLELSTFSFISLLIFSRDVAGGSPERFTDVVINGIPDFLIIFENQCFARQTRKLSQC